MGDGAAINRACGQYAAATLYQPVRAMVAFGMFEPGVSAFRSSFELWREDGVIRSVMAPGTDVQVRDMKEVLRLVGALDPTARAPLLLEFDRCTVRPEALALLCRVRRTHAQSVALCTRDALLRYQAAHLRDIRGTSFQLRVFDDLPKACAWVRERVQLAGIMG